MKPQSESAPHKKWLKLAIVPLLLGVLGVVLWNNRAPSASDAPAVLVTPTATVVANSGALRKQEPKRVKWPKLSHEQILATNPFRGSAAMRAALQPVEEPVAANANLAVSNSEPDIDAVEGESIDPWSSLVENFHGKSKSVYIETSKGPAMKIGERLWQVGDRIGERYRITDIRPEGIVVEAAPAMK